MIEVAAMATGKLTKRVVDGAAPREARYTLFDAGEASPHTRQEEHAS
jgi:hypothetical protein